MTVLDGSSNIIFQNARFELIYPGFTGEVESTPIGPVSGSLRGPAPSGQVSLPFAQALERGHLQEVQSLKFSNLTPVPGFIPEATPGRAGQAVPTLFTPDYGPHTGHVVLVINEDGRVSWTFPEVDGRNLSGGPLEDQKEFRLNHVAPSSSVGLEPSRPGRGLVGSVVGAILKVFVYPLIDPILGVAAKYLASAWENHNRPHLFRAFAPSNYQQTPSPETILNSSELRSLMATPTSQEVPVLVFLHGAFSQGHSAFDQLPDLELSALHAHYAGRVLAFDHPTMSASPEENASHFLQLIPPEVANVRFDFICHSRGGLVARGLAKALAHNERQLRVGNIIFVASPNHGTPLADGKRWRALLDRISTGLNVLLPATLAVTSILEGIVTAVKVVGVGALNGLPGLKAMDPAILQTAGFADLDGPRRFGICTEFEPELNSGLALMLRDQAVDTEMEKANDLVVPTLGVLNASLPSAVMYQYEKGSAVAHFNYFKQPKTHELLRKWLGL